MTIWECSTSTLHYKRIFFFLFSSKSHKILHPPENIQLTDAEILSSRSCILSHCKFCSNLTKLKARRIKENLPGLGSRASWTYLEMKKRSLINSNNSDIGYFLVDSLESIVQRNRSYGYDYHAPFVFHSGFFFMLWKLFWYSH